MAVVVQESLYVGDLHHDVVDGQLYDTFSEFKSLTSVRVCRDTSTRRSLGYGYVNFVSRQDAVSAIEAKNNSTLNGKVIRVTWSRRDPDLRKSGIGNVFVKNLSETIDNVKLQELFQKFGNILSCKVVVFEDGKSKGYGFVQFESEESALAAIENLNGTTVEGKQMYVGKFVRKSDRSLPSEDAKYTNLYIKNLDTDVTEELLNEKFSAFGKIASLVISRDDNEVSRGFGFVNFDNPNDARKAMETTNGSLLGLKVLYVAKAQKKAEREQILHQQFEDRRKEQILKCRASNVYIKNIADDVTDDELREHFSECGMITSAKVMRDDKGISKGFGFVCFSTPEEANKAVNKIHGYMFHHKPLYVAIAQRKDERAAQLKLQLAQRMVSQVPPPAIIHEGFSPMYYTPNGVVSQVPPGTGLLCPSLGLRPGWGAFQQSPIPLVPNSPRQQRHNRGRMNGHMHAQGGAHVVSYVTHSQRTQSLTSSKDSNSYQRAGQVKFLSNGRLREMNKGNGAPPATRNSGGSDMLSSMLSASPPEQQKQILGERIFPLVKKLKPELAEKITGMLLEMDNSELLLLLESHESLVSKVKEAVQVLKLSKTKASTKDALHPSHNLSSQVAVN